MVGNSDSLLIYAPVPLFQTESGLWLEDQACNGLRLWAENFQNVTAMLPVEFGQPPPSWRPVETVGPNLERLNIIPLPTAYRPDQFCRHYLKTKQLIRAEIEKADYLSFSMGGLFGDWGSVSCNEAYKMGRPYAVWTDRVESEVVRRTSRSGPLRRRLRARVEHRPMAWLERRLVRRAELGLFHGKETYDTYAPFCRHPVVVHDIHISKAEHISASDLKAKVSASANGPLKIGYVGRAGAMKGPFDWVAVLDKLKRAGTEFEAFWLGDGPDLAKMQVNIDEAGLSGQVSLLGYADNREQVLKRFREADIFMFCHKTPESPRCLIEALISGTPIVGYEGAFAKDLIGINQGGHLVALGDVDGLVEVVDGLAKDRSKLADLMARAARDGAPFDDESVFHHRSEVIRENL